MKFFSPLQKATSLSLLAVALTVATTACSTTSTTTEASPAASSATSATTEASPSTSPSTTSASSTAPSATSAGKTKDAGKHSHGGRNVVEANGIHLEFESAPQGNQTHVGVMVQRGEKHEPIPTAKVSMQVQTPDGKTQMVPLKYEDEHFSGTLPVATKGQYQVKVSAMVDGKEVGGRFSFER